MSNKPLQFWTDKRQALRDHLEKDDPDDFLRWSTITATMWVGDDKRTGEEFAALQKNGWKRWARVLTEEGFGAPVSEYHPTSGNLIHQAYHLYIYEKLSGRKVEHHTRIAEAGGGYGAMTRLIYSLSFRGDYYALDLPEMLQLQTRYLKAFLPIAAYHQTSDVGNFTTSARHVDMLIGLYSISEMPLEMRERLFFEMNPQSYLLAYQGNFEGLDNEAYFTELVKRKPEYHWRFADVPSLMINKYLVGWK